MSGHHGHRDHHHHHAAGLGPPVLDIGGDVGALVATLDATMAGTELFLRPDDEPRSTVHTGVWDRHDAGTAVTAAVFPQLVAGIYHVLDERGVVVRTVDVRGGEVTTIDLRR
jgi:hypothetical protein